jgi:phosphoglycolate phosphatase
MIARALPRPRAAIFDWDNTLVDTWGVIHDSINAALIAMGHAPWSQDETRARVRRALRESFPDLFGERWREAQEVFYRTFHAIHLERLEVMPGAEALLEGLAGRGVWLGVVSNKNGENLRKEVAHLGWNPYFRRVIGANDCARDKPAPDPVHRALEGSGIDAGGDVWFVGDTSTDIECARNAGCIPVLLREIAPISGEFGAEGEIFHFRDRLALESLVRDLEWPISD